MIISIDRIAEKIAGRPAAEARDTLKAFKFTPAEAGEICTAHWLRDTNTIDPDWGAIAVTIRSTVACSIRTGDRKGFQIG